MSSCDTPAVARRKVRLAIKEARSAKRYTQSHVAEAMDWSLSKVMRIESGEVTITQNDLRPLLAFLGVKDRKRVDELVAAAKASKQRRQWWDEKQFHGMLTPAMRQLISFEAETTVMRHFCSAVFPGFLQTREYARGVMKFYELEMTEQEIGARIESRIRRNETLRGRNPRPQVYALLDQSILMRTLGDPLILGRQLSDVLDVIDDGWVTVRISPFDSPHLGIGTFEILYLGTEEVDQAILYRESSTTDEIVEDPVKLEQHRSLWNRMWTVAVSEEDSVAIIRRRVDELLGTP